MRKKVNIIGSGFSSLSAASYLAKQGFEVTVFEKKRADWGKSKTVQKRWFYL